MSIEHISAEVILFFIIYGVTGVIPLIAAVYLLLRRGNAFAPGVEPPVRLRRWAASFFVVSSLGHVWWYLFYLYSGDVNSAAYVLGIAGRSEFWGYQVVHYWQLGVIAVFVVYYIIALRQYERWLLDNYADLEHKEVWQSMVFIIVLLAVYMVYTSNAGELVREYLSQIITLVIIAFLLWRVETLQKLDNEL